jgi:tRNA(Ile)-lysidine synthase
VSGTDEFLAALRLGLHRCELKTVRVLIGVSGGADSVALFLGLCELRNEFALSLHVAHLNHHLRGAASDADAAWVETLCRSHLQIPVEIGDVQLVVAQGAVGLEEAARNARHRFLDEAAVRHDCDVIVTAHSADDQVETVLHHIFRGTGIAGLRGIPSERQTASGRRLVRPMLAIRRELIERYLAEIGQDFRTDGTNTDTSLTRNWLRHELLPQLRSHFGSRIDSSLTRLASQATEIESTLTILADRLLAVAVLDSQPETVRLDVRPLVGQPRHLVREAFRLLWQRQQWPCQSMGFAEWDRVAEVAMVGASANLPGGILARKTQPNLLVLSRSDRGTVLRS